MRLKLQMFCILKSLKQITKAEECNFLKGRHKKTLTILNEK
jgi:hypothetical protein